MLINASLLTELLQSFPEIKLQNYFKSSLTALSHAMEDQILAEPSTGALIIASFQRERFYRQEAHRYQRIAQHTDHVYVLAAPETEFTNASFGYETIAFNPDDALAQEWHLVVLGVDYSYCLVCRERKLAAPKDLDSTRSFEGLWTFDRQISCQAARLLLNRVVAYRPELAAKVEQAHQIYLNSAESIGNFTNPDPFVQRLVSYLQAGQYKLIKAYNSIANQEEKERLLNAITTAIRRSLNSEEMLEVAVQHLGQALDSSRCLLYRCQNQDSVITIEHEFVKPGLPSLRGQRRELASISYFQQVMQGSEPVYVPDTQGQIPARSCLLVPVIYQGQRLGILELHHCGSETYHWSEEELGLVEAIANQLGVALIQAESYRHLEDLNQQLAALDRTRSNLVAITGHELRTPLSTIQVCLESLASEPDMPTDMRQLMLKIALQDADRMRKLIQDFLTLSMLESGRVEWNPEPLSIQECVSLALSSIRARWGEQPCIVTALPDDLPQVKADGEWLVEVLTKLLDNACKFTSPQGKVVVQSSAKGGPMMEVMVADTGRGIEPSRLEAVFDRFYQEEGALRRSAGGTGLGLAICRQIVSSWGGRIWADSAGKDQGSEFHFTIPIFNRDDLEYGQNG